MRIQRRIRKICWLPLVYILWVRQTSILDNFWVERSGLNVKLVLLKYRGGERKMSDTNDNFYRHIGVYGVCMNDERILAIRKILGPYTGKYDLPGGRLEKMESLEQGITRELREETGYTIRKLNNIGVCDFTVLWTPQENTVENLHHIVILYEVDVDLADINNAVESFEGQDSSGAIWLALDEATTNNSSPLVLQAIEWIRSGTIPVVSGSFDYRI